MFLNPGGLKTPFLPATRKKKDLVDLFGMENGRKYDTVGRCYNKSRFLKTLRNYVVFAAQSVVYK